MIIQNMFAKGIDRPINGVVKVNQDEVDILEQELDEYIITRELKKHIITFFNNYLEAFDVPTADVGVWISGFFGSGKSHFLKMLSYLLCDREVKGIRTVERFRVKPELAEDPATFELIERATRAGHTDTILFNIDIEGSINKDKTAVLRVFAKMFYTYLGFYGEDLKVAKLERFIERKGKTAEFRRVFEEKSGDSWLNSRDAYAFLEDDIVATLREVLGMSETAATNWFNGSESVETSIAQLVSEIKEYVDTKPADFRLLFMIDEVGQYVGSDTNLLINLQSLVEEIGNKCAGRVWVICTGQEAVDEIIRTRENEFSRIMARFKTRLSLSSSSVDEVIQKRILLKKDDVKVELEKLYAVNEAVLHNLFTFTDALLDIKGYVSADEFARTFPFVPYQFILMQKVFAEIRKHGNSGKHLSGGERSMLSGFQEAAQKIERRDEYTIAPFYLFYDTVHGFLDSTIRRVIERSERAAAAGNGIEPQDVSVLKLLYLVRYIDDIKANLDNIVILMADDIRMDKIIMREQVRKSLDRLLDQNYIARTGDTYNFLTDEEQDIQREIRNTAVPGSEVTRSISQMIFVDIYASKKYRLNNRYDFPFDQFVDGQMSGTPTGAMELQVFTAATDPAELTDTRLALGSRGKAFIVLADNPYYEDLENAMKIRKYVKGRNVSQLPKSVQDIIRDQQGEASNYERRAAIYLSDAIVGGRFYVDGEAISLRPGSVSVSDEDPDKRELRYRQARARSVIDQALKYLVSHIYSELGLIVENCESDDDIRGILRGDPKALSVMEANAEAADKVEKYLDLQQTMTRTITMEEVQRHYQVIPYGWREIDIAAVVAMLIRQQRVTVKYAGNVIRIEDPRLMDMLRKKNEIGRTHISKRAVPRVQDMRRVREFMRDFFDEMSVPEDEDGLIRHIQEKFEAEQQHYSALLARYQGHDYPDRPLVEKAIALMRDVLLQRGDNIALLRRIIELEDDLDEMKAQMQPVEDFFKSRVAVFDSAVRFDRSLRNDLDYIARDEAANAELNALRLIITVKPGAKFDYRQLPTLNEKMATVKASHDAMLEAKRAEILEFMRQCMESIHQAAGDGYEARAVSNKADEYFDECRQKIADTEELALLDGLTRPMLERRDAALAKIDAIVHPKPQPPKPPKPRNEQPTAKEKKYKSVYRQVMFPKSTLESEAEIDAYLARAREDMVRKMQGFDGIVLN